MSEWPLLSLSEAGVSLFDCVHKTPPGVEVGLPYVTIPEMKGGRLDLAAARRMSEEDFGEWTKKAFPRAHDVVLSRRCNPGETAPVEPGAVFALGQNLVLLRSDGTTVYPPFLRWLVGGPDWWDQIRKFLNVGAVFDSLRCADIPNFRLPIPPLSDQRAIADILGSLDDKIELNRRMNRTLEEMAAAIFKAWFVDFEPVKAKAAGAKSFPSMPQEVFDTLPTEFTDSSLGPIPQTWTCERLGDLADVSWGDTITTKRFYTADGFTAYSAKGPDGFLPYHDFDRTGVVVSAIGANSGATWLARGRWSCIKNTIRFWSTSKTVSTEYLYHATRDPMSWPLRGSAQPFISQSDARALRVLAPGNTLGIVFGCLVEPYYEQAFANRRQNATLTSIREALLPKLLSGEIRVGEAERIVEDVA